MRPVAALLFLTVPPAASGESEPPRGLFGLK